MNFHTLIQTLKHSFEVRLIDSSAKTLITANPNKDKTDLTIWDLETYRNKKNTLLKRVRIIEGFLYEYYIHEYFTAANKVKTNKIWVFKKHNNSKSYNKK